MEMVEDIVIVGAGISGLATSLGLHRLGYRSLVLESSDSSRVSGFALTIWTNAWRALDALGIDDSLRQHHLPLHEGKADFKASHGFDPNLFQFVGEGVRVGFLPLDEKFVYWFLTYTPSIQDKEMEHNPLKMKQYALSKLGKGADNMVAVLENTGLDTVSSAPLRYRRPWEVLWGNISKGNVCVAGDALHPMTPDLGQGGCSALEDGVVLARCLAEALSKKPNAETKVEIEKDEYYNIKSALEKYASERKWRCFNLITTSYLMGVVQQSSGILGFLREKFLSKYLAGLLLKEADFDCGKL